MAPTAPLTLPIGASENAVRVHPVVLFTICDAYLRRGKGQERVIGTLLGTVGDGFVDVKNCYAVPHSESQEQVALDVQHHQTMAALQARVSPRERVVGWFSTAPGVAGPDALIHSFYAGEAPAPVLLTVDTTLRGGSVALRAYTSRALSLGGRELAREFAEVALEVRTAEAERAAGALLAAEAPAPLPSDAAGLEAALGALCDALGAARRYADDVAAGRRPGSAAAGRALADAAAALPPVGRERFAALISSARADAVLAVYFAGLVKAQVALADRLGTMQLPLL